MKRAASTALAGFTLAVLAASPAAAQAGAPADPAVRLVQEMEALNRNLEKVATLLEGLLTGQETDMLMKRVEFMSRRLSPLEQELRNAKAERDKMVNERGSLLVPLEEAQRALDDAGGESIGASPPDWAVESKARIEARLTLLDESLDALDLRVMEMENDLAARREEIEGWEEYLDKQIGLR